MSVEFRTIVIFGKNIGVKEFRRVEELDEALSESNLFVLDGMCGSYCYFGLPLAYISEQDDEVFEMGDDVISEAMIEYSEDFEKCCEMLGLTEEDLKLIIFIHSY